MDCDLGKRLKSPAKFFGFAIAHVKQGHIYSKLQKGICNAIFRPVLSA